MPSSVISVDQVLNCEVHGVSRRVLLSDVAATDDIGKFEAQMQVVPNFPKAGMKDVLKMLQKRPVLVSRQESVAAKDKKDEQTEASEVAKDKKEDAGKASGGVASASVLT